MNVRITITGLGIALLAGTSDPLSPTSSGILFTFISDKLPSLFLKPVEA